MHKHRRVSARTAQSKNMFLLRRMVAASSRAVIFIRQTTNVTVCSNTDVFKTRVTQANAICSCGINAM